jgi:diguanylate cyclase (GGDEF)-like protein
VYVELIYLLSHLRFDVADACRHWRGIVEHRGNLEQRSGSRIDLRVALVSYFLQVNRQYENPKVIELRLFEQTRASAYRDELTGLYNYRFFTEQLTRELSRSDRGRSPLSLVMVDVDDFKRYNDGHGHEAGNAALREVARLLSDSVRDTDLVTRYGGEEFAVILPDTLKLGAKSVAERMRTAVERAGFGSPEGRSPAGLTISAGVATCPGDTVDADELVRCADRALYQAKGVGKNSVQLYGGDQRSHPRSDLALRGSYRVLSARPMPMTTVNLSEGGALFVAERPLPAGEAVEIRLDLPVEGEVVFLGRATGLRGDSEQGREVGLRIIDMQRDHMERLSRFLRATRLLRS